MDCLVCVDCLVLGYHRPTFLGVCCAVNEKKGEKAFRYSFKFRASSFSVLTKAGNITG